VQAAASNIAADKNQREAGKTHRCSGDFRGAIVDFIHFSRVEKVGLAEPARFSSAAKTRKRCQGARQTVEDRTDEQHAAGDHWTGAIIDHPGGNLVDGVEHTRKTDRPQVRAAGDISRSTGGRVR
jgi:hypothetical protein